MNWHFKAIGAIPAKFWILVIPLIVLLSGCHGQLAGGQNGEPDGDGPIPSKQEAAAWIRKHQLHKASVAEIRIAQSFLRPFRNKEAVSPDGRIAVSFTLGEAIPLENSRFTSSSVYIVTDRTSGKELLRIPSSLTKKFNDPSVPNSLPFTQEVWFLPDGRILLQQSWADGCSPHDMLVLVDLASQSSSKIRYLALPEHDWSPWAVERGAYTFGIVGDWIIFNPLLSDQPFKKKLSELPEASSPLPFGIG